MSEQAQTEETGVEEGSVAGDQGQTQTEDTTGEAQTELPGGEPVQQAFAARLSQERDKINQQLQSTFGVGLDDLQSGQAPQTGFRQLTPVGQPQMQPQYGYQQPQLTPAEMNQQLADMLYENPAGVLSAVANSAVQSVTQQLAPMYHQVIENDMRNKYQDFEAVKPVVDEILRHRPDLMGNPQGMEMAYWTARGVMADELIAQATNEAKAGREQTTQARAQATAQAGQPSQQGGGTSGNPDKQLADFIAGIE